MPKPSTPTVKQVSTGGPPLGLIAGVVVLVVALVGALVLWTVTRGSDLQAGGSANVLPEGGGVTVGPGVDADVPQVHVYEDFQCPWCGLLEESIGEQLAQRAEAGEINLTFTLMSFLDSRLGNDSSHRAANAALCADDAGAFVPFHAAVFAGQPAEEGAGWTDEELLGFAEQAGVSGAEAEDFSTCMTQDTYGDYVTAMQERANRDGVTGTPFVTIDGEALESTELQSLLEDGATLDKVLADHS